MTEKCNSSTILPATQQFMIDCRKNMGTEPLQQNHIATEPCLYETMKSLVLTATVQSFQLMINFSYFYLSFSFLAALNCVSLLLVNIFLAILGKDTNSINEVQTLLDAKKNLMNSLQILFETVRDVRFFLKKETKVALKAARGRIGQI